MDNFDITRIVDGVVKGLGESMYQLPKEIKEVIRKNYILPPLSIPTEKPGDQLLLEIYVSNTGGLLWRIRDTYGTQLYERAFT